MATIMRVGGGAGGGKSSNPAISTLTEGKIVFVNENGIPAEYYVAKHDYEPTLNGNGRTLLVRKNIHSSRQWHTSDVNNYPSSAVNTWLNGEFFNGFSASVKELIGATSFVACVGNGNYTNTTMVYAVFLLSMAELGVGAGYANIPTQGSALPIASTLVSVGADQWSRTPYTSGTKFVSYIDKNKAAQGGGASASLGVRPAFTIPASATVTGVDTQGRYYLEAETFNDVYGIARDITASSPEWARTDGSAGFSATASIGTVAGASDFDNIYPWSEMKRVTLDTGDVMVRIPKFYYGRYRNGNIERIQISGRADVGLTLHPAFNHAGVEQDCIYVGAYKTSAQYTSYHRSVSGDIPLVKGTRATFRAKAKEKGAGWSIIDISTLSAIQMLYLVEFANNNSQAMIGRGYVDGNTAAINTGSCDTVPNLTGRPAGTDGKTDIVYRGIEGIWGNLWEWVDGINWNGSIYVCNDPSKYADDTTSNYSLLSYTGATNWNGVYIKEMGVDTTGHSHIMLPTTAVSASESTYICDAIWTTTGWRVYIHGGDWTSLSRAGLFTVDIIRSASLASQYFGSRLIYIP